MPTIKTGIRFSKKQPLSEQELRQLHAYWRAANYLTACQLYLMDNPLLERPLVKSDLKQTIVGHWGTCPGQNFIYTHLDRVIKRNDLDMIYLSGPGHGGNAMVAQDWLDGSYTEVYPNITRDKEGMQKLFKRFSFPGGIPSHVAPETPGSIHEGGELGYSLAHAFGAVADNPDLIAACVVGDGEAETGPLATSWHGNKFVNPITDGAVLPILHLNGFKIANPTIFSRMSSRGGGVLLPWLRLGAVLCGGRRPHGHAPADGGGAGPGHPGDQAHPAGGPQDRRGQAAPLAHDRAAHPQGLDRPQGGGRAAGGELLASPSGAYLHGDRHRPAPRPAGGVAALL